MLSFEPVICLLDLKYTCTHREHGRKERTCNRPAGMFHFFLLSPLYISGLFVNTPDKVCFPEAFSNTDVNIYTSAA